MKNFLTMLFILVPAVCFSVQETESVLEAGGRVEKVAGDMAFTEGPVWVPEMKRLIFSDIPNSKWMQWSPQDGLSVFRESQQANGNALDLEGRIVSCQHRARNVIRIEKNGEIIVLTDRFDGKRFNSPNDIAIKSDGTLWFTDPAWGLSEKHELPGHWVFKLNPDTGELTPLIKDLAMPNGINFSPDEKRIYVADTGGHPKHPDPNFHQTPAGIHCYEISETGELGKKLFQINHGSDGMVVDASGNLYTTDGRIRVYNPQGKLLEEIIVPENPANVAFGDADFKTLYITAQTSLYRVRLRHAGAKPPGAKW